MRYFIFFSLLVLLNNLYYFTFEDSLFLGGSCPVVTLNRIGILSFSGDLELRTQLLCACSHQDLIVNVGKSIELDAI
jgi:hypothetical protein